MGQFTLLSAASELPQAAASYETEDMMEVAAHLDILREVPFNVAAGFRIWSEKLLAEYPIRAEVTEQLQELYSAISRLGIQCDEIAIMFRKYHQADIARREAPRTGEHKWNVRR